MSWTLNQTWSLINARSPEDTLRSCCNQPVPCRDLRTHGGNVIAPLSFTDPEQERETYVAAFVAVLNDKSDGQPSLTKSILRLMSYGFSKADINRFVAEAHEKQFDMIRKRS